MHPSLATLIAFGDGEIGPRKSRRTARHLAKCDTCRAHVRRIQREKHDLSAGAGTAGIGDPPDWTVVRTAIANWRRNPSGPAELRKRLRWQIETYFGSAAVRVVERSGTPEEFLGKTGEMLDVFLGEDAAQAVRDDVLEGLGVWR
jgi:anti-sigma factor RsiW